MKIWLSQIIGVAKPLPGIFTFHRMLFVSLQVVGGWPAGATPVPNGPRHCGQFSVAEDAAAGVVSTLAHGTKPKSAAHNHPLSRDHNCGADSGRACKWPWNSFIFLPTGNLTAINFQTE